LLGVKEEEFEERCWARWKKRVIIAVVMKFDLTLLIEGREERVGKTCNQLRKAEGVGEKQLEKLVECVGEEEPGQIVERSWGRVWRRLSSVAGDKEIDNVVK